MISRFPLVSVIVNIYNEEEYISQCVDSILSQTYQNLEIILVDDGSQDATPDICANFEKAYGSVRCILKKNEGLVRSR